MIIFNLLIIAILILLTAFFVASEFAIVKVRKTRIDQLIKEGNKKALAAKEVIMNLDGYLSAVQLGITITALGLGWLGEPTVEHLLHPIFLQLNLNEAIAKTLSFIIAFSLITFFHVVLGELAPKTLAIQKAEAIALFTARSLIWFYKLMFPFIWALNHSARLFIHLFGLKSANEHEVAHSEEELRLILTESFKRGQINQAEYKYVNNIFEFDERIAREIMVPRMEVVGIYKEDSFTDNLNLMLKERYTRYPVFDEDKDHITGMIHIKEILSVYVEKQGREESIEPFIRPVIHVIDTIPIYDLLVKMQKSHIHLAVLIDEYGGTSGIVTVEDILEEIVGEIQDEFDQNEKPLVEVINPNQYILDGKVLVSEVNDLFSLEIRHEDVDTIGGWILTDHMDIKEGDMIQVEDTEFKVIEMDDHHIKSIQVTKMNKNE